MITVLGSAEDAIEASIVANPIEVDLRRLGQNSFPSFQAEFFVIRASLVDIEHHKARQSIQVGILLPPFLERLFESQAARQPPLGIGEEGRVDHIEAPVGDDRCDRNLLGLISKVVQLSSQSEISILQELGAPVR